uniref:Uncharacterized protein n=1 Tax=Photinus pyralis TaxID=7054 RepID=A0A1Y1MN03_PHOPY
MEIESSKNSSQRCACLPPCVSLSYDVETSYTDWNWKGKVKALYNNDNISYNGVHFSRLSVYYKDLQFLSCMRSEMFSAFDFASKVGGLLGLFIGFSITSAIEIVYFGTLRVGFNTRRHGIGVWFGETKRMKAH